jgi:hypothetical protein
MKTMRVHVTWDVTDDLITMGRPRTLTIDTDLTKEEWDEMSDEDQILYLDGDVQDDFDREVGYTIDIVDVEEVG